MHESPFVLRIPRASLVVCQTMAPTRCGLLRASSRAIRTSHSHSSARRSRSGDQRVVKAEAPIEVLEDLPFESHVEIAARLARPGQAVVERELRRDIELRRVLAKPLEVHRDQSLGVRLPLSRAVVVLQAADQAATECDSVLVGVAQPAAHAPAQA